VTGGDVCISQARMKRYLNPEYLYQIPSPSRT
jgi:hypothetical protein